MSSRQRASSASGAALPMNLRGQASYPAFSDSGTSSASRCPHSVPRWVCVAMAGPRDAQRGARVSAPPSAVSTPDCEEPPAADRGFLSNESKHKDHHEFYIGR